ncbi:MAG: UDP-N-acetylmuramoyl-L-alanyl-D-glutamate--2,6-diaminopimelate ligase [Acidimicrobiales bacterium]
MRLDDATDRLADRRLLGDASVAVDDVVHDSRQAGPGRLFACLVGATHDGHDHASGAVHAGAPALLAQRPLDLDVPQVIVADTRAALGPVAARVHGDPSRALTMVGVTGTNGKTTTTSLLRNVLAADGRTADVLGTLTGVRTTPEATDLQRWLAQARRRGVEAVAMEVSSHALDQRRVAATHFDVAVFTNLSRDHLDYHGTMEAYFQAKALLFTPEYCDRAVVNLDSPHGRLLRDSAKVPTTGFTLADAVDLSLHAGGSTFRWRGHRVELQLGGRFNVANALAAAAAAEQLGIDDAVVAAGLSAPVVVPGRFELVDAGQPFTVVVDFAHTPDGLEQLLTAARELAGDHRVVVVFGCGGDRDPTKRAPMGEVAARLADRVVLTADNSRGERTDDIISTVKQGYDTAADRRATDLVVEPDRESAIALALAGAAEGDLVVVAGKGHETGQTIGGVTTPFDDREVVARLLGERTRP